MTDDCAGRALGRKLGCDLGCEQAGSDPRFSLAPDPAPDGAGSVQGVAPRLLAGQVACRSRTHE